MSRYLYTGDHADTLASGRRIAPGDDVIPASAVTPDHEPDRSLLADGVLSPLGAPDFDVAASSIDAVMTWVGDNDARRREALALEEARGDDARSTLIEKLTKENP